MKITLLNKKLETPVFAVPEFNYGQMQRWEGVERLRYSIEVETALFIEKFSEEFASFRENEIQENDYYNLEELEAYKEAGWPTLKELFKSNIPLLKELILYHQYEILHLLIQNASIGKLFYSINSIDTVVFKNSKIELKGICFEIDRR